MDKRETMPLITTRRIGAIRARICVMLVKDEDMVAAG